MPTYSYKCKKCSEGFEAFRSISARDEKIECPKCASLETERLVDATSSRFNLKGNGWYNQKG